jgi:hypothetical protein
MNIHTPKWIPFWELESRWIPKSSKSDYRGQNPLNWGVPYIIEKLLELKCLKWARMTHLDTSYGQKKGQKSKSFDSWPLKVENHPDLLACRWCATYVWKALDKVYNFASNSCRSEVYTQSYGTPKSWESQLWQFRDSYLGVPGQNAIWMWALWKGMEYTIRGKVVASPSPGCGESCESESTRGSSSHQKCCNNALTNLLFGFVQVHVSE